MPRTPFADLVSAPEFKALPLEEQQTVAKNYWGEVAAEQPEQAEFIGRLGQASQELVTLKAQRDVAPSVQRRLTQSRIDAASAVLSLGIASLEGRLSPEQREQTVKAMEAEQASRRERDKKTASLFDPKVQEAMAPAFATLKETAAMGGVFGSPRLDARISDLLPGGESGVVDSSRAAYESSRNQFAKDFNLEPAEVDDKIRRELDLHEEPVSRDAFGTPYIKNEVLAAGAEATEAAIMQSTLPWEVKQKMVKDLPARLDTYRKSVLDSVRKESPELAEELLDPSRDDATNFQNLVKSLNDSRTEQFAKGTFSGLLGTVDLFSIPTNDELYYAEIERQVIQGERPWYDMPARSETESSAKSLQRRIDAVNQLSAQFNKSKTEIWGTDAAAFGSGAYSVAEAVGVGALTGGTGAAIPLSRIATMGKTGARLARFANGAIASSPVAGFIGAKSALGTYEQAIDSDMSSEEAFKLALTSGSIEAAVTMLFSGFGAGGVEDVGRALVGGTAKQTARESAKSAYRMFGEKLAIGMTGEQLEEGLITALDAVAVQARINPDMTMEDLQKQLKDTALVTLAVSGPTVGVGALKETLASKPTYEHTTDEIELQADLIHADALADATGTADLPSPRTDAADTEADSGSAAPGAPQPVETRRQEPVAGTPGVAGEMPGVRPEQPAEPVLVPADAEVAPADRPSPNLPPRADFSVKPRPPQGGGKEGRIARMEWDDLYENTHNPDGSPIQPTVLEEVALQVAKGLKDASFDERIDAIGSDLGVEFGTTLKQLLNDGWVWSESENRMVDPKGRGETPLQALTRIRSDRNKQPAEPVLVPADAGVTQPTPTDETKVQEQKAGGLPPVQEQPAVQAPAVQTETGAAQREGEGAQEVAPIRVGDPIGENVSTAPEGTVVEADLGKGVERITREGDSWVVEDGTSVAVRPTAKVVETVKEAPEDVTRPEEPVKETSVSELEVVKSLVSSETPEDSKPHAALLDEQGVPKRLFHGKAAPFKNSEFQIRPNQLTNLSGLGPAWFSTSRNQAERFVGGTPEGLGEVVEPTRIDIRNPLVLRGSPESADAVRENRKILDLFLKIGQVSRESISDEDFEILKQYLLERGVTSIRNKRTADLQPWAHKVLVGDEASRTARKEARDLMEGTHPEADPFGQLKRLLKEAEITLSASGVETKGMTEGEMLRRALELEGKDGIVLLETMADTKVDDEPSDWVIPFRPDQLIFEEPVKETPEDVTRPDDESAFRETYRQPEPEWNEVFDTLRERDPETKTIDTDSPQFKQLVSEIRDRRTAERAGRLVQQRADIQARRDQIEADRRAREKERKARRKQAAAERPLDVHQARIKEITKHNHDDTSKIRDWLDEKGYTGPIGKNDLRTVLFEKTAKSTAKTEKLREMYQAQTPEVQMVLQSLYRMRQKGKETHPELVAFSETPLGELILDMKLKSRSWFRRNKLPVPPAYDALKKHGRIRAHIASSVFSNNGATPEDIISELDAESFYTSRGMSLSGRNLNFTEADVIQAVIDLDEGKIQSEEGFDDYMEQQQRNAEDAEIAFAEQQLAAVQGDVQTVDLREVRKDDAFTMGGVTYQAIRVKADQKGDTQSFILRGEGPLNRVEVTQDFFAESVTPTQGSLAHVDPAEIEAISVMQQFPEEFEQTGPQEAPPQEALAATFNRDAEWAAAMDALVKASGLDISRIKLQRGGVPGEASMSQMDDRDSEYLAAVERGDVETAQRMVDEAARAAGYAIFYHGSTSPDVKTIEDLDPELLGFWAEDESSAATYTQGGAKPLRGAILITNPIESDLDPDSDLRYEFRKRDYPTLENMGYDAVDVLQDYSRHGGRVVIPFKKSQIKSADPVTRDADGNVIPLSQRFNPESPSILYQAPRGAKGSFEILPDTGDILLRGFAAADESTGAREFGHAVRRMLLDRRIAPENRVGISDEDIAIAEEWAGATNGVWDTAAEEEFARGLERYLRDGKAPTPILQPVFDKFAEWLGRIYRNVTGSPIDVEISDAMREVFGKLLTRGLPQEAPQAAPQAAPQPQAPQPGEARAPPQEAPPQPKTPTASQPRETPEDESLVGMRNASTDTRRARVNLPPRAAPIRLSNQEAWDTALDRLADNENAGFNLVVELTESPRSIDPVETALYTHELLTREHALDKALDRYNTNPNKGNFEAMQQASAAVAEAILTAERIGTIEGRALQARKILIHQDFTLARAVAMATAANGGQQLNEAQLKEVTELHKQLQDLQTKLEAANAEIAKQEAEKVFSVEVTFKKELKQAKARGEKPLSWLEKKAEESRAWLKANARGRVNMNLLPVEEVYHLSVIGVSYIAKGINKVGDFTAQLVKDFGKKYLPFANDIFAKSQEMYSSAAPSAKIKSREKIFEGLGAQVPLNDKAIFELVRYYINEGVKGFEPVMGAVLQDLRQFYPDLTLRDVHDAYSKYGQTYRPSQAEDLKTARDYRSLSRLMSQREDALSGKAPKRTGLIRDEPTKAVRDLTKQVNDAMRRMKIRPTSDSDQLRSSFEAIKTRLRNDYEDFDVAIRKGEAKKERSPQTFTAAEQAELDRLRRMRDDRKADYEAVFGTKTLPEEEVRRRALALIDRRIDEERQMLRDGILKRMRDFKMGPWSPEMAAKKKILDQLKADRRERQNAARPKKPEDIKKYERDLASLERRIKEEEALLAAGLAARQKEFQMGRWSPQLAEMQARLDELRDKRREFAKSLEPEKDIAKIEYDRAMKVLEASIQRYKDVIAGVEKPGAGRKYTVDEAMQALIDTRDALRDAAEAVRDADPARRDKRKQVVLKQLEKGIAETTRKIQDGDLSTKAKNDPFGSDPDVTKLREVRDSLNKTLAIMRRNALPKRSPEEIRASRDRKMLETKIAKLKQRLEANDYSKPVKLPPPDYRERNALLKEKNDLQAKFNEGLLALQLAQRSRGKKILDNTVDVVFGVSRAMLTSFDAGAFGRQAGLVNFMRPNLARKNFPANFAFTENAAGRYESELEAHPDYARAVAAKLSLTSWRPGSSLSDMEEVYRSRIAKKIPGVAASERAYVTYLNVTRFTYFNALVNSLPVVEQTEANLKALARHVNIATGRGDLGKLEASAKGLAAVFFSPKYWWSRLQVLGNLIYIPLDAVSGFRLGPKETVAARKIVLVEYARLVGMMGLVFSLFAFAKDAFDLDDEEFMIGTDPNSSDFGKLRMGNTRIDFMAGLLQNIVFISRMVTGEKTTGSGKRVPISGNIERKFGQNRFTETVRLLRTKLSPAAGSIVNFLDEQDVVGNKFTPETEVLGSYIPMSAAELYGSIRELGFTAGTAAGLLSFIGIGASTYGGEEDYVIEQDIMTGVFMIDQSRYDAEEKETKNKFRLPPAKF